MRYLVTPLLFLLLLLNASVLTAQIVTTSPTLPLVDEAVTITFDATQGTGGLADCGCDVYVHTGVFTDQSPTEWTNVVTMWAVTNPAWRMTPVPGQPNKYTYTIGPDIRSYYGVPAGVTINSMNFVFRNGDGSLEGKATGGGDIFIDVFQSSTVLTASLQVAANGLNPVPLGRQVNLTAAATTDATLSLYQNGTLLTSQTGVSEFDYSLSFTTIGTQTLELVAEANGMTDTSTVVLQSDLVVDFTQPTQPISTANVGDMLTVSATSYINANLALLVNGDPQVTEAGAETISLNNYTFTEPGLVTFEVAAQYNGVTRTNSVQVIVLGDLPAMDPPNEMPNGLTRFGTDSVYLQLYAPGKQSAFVLGNFSDWRLETRYQMNQSVDGTYFWVGIGGLDTLEDLTFQYLVDATIRTADPLSELVLDQFNDPFIGEETFPGIPDYPVGKTQGIVSWVRLDEPEYNWVANDYVPGPKEELVIYELLVRDFVDAHNYQTLIDTLDYLQRLNINAIELMPVNEFEGNISWGYNPSFHKALDKYYGSPEAFKAFVDECHIRNIAVIVDVVYNHAFSQSPLAQLWWDQANFRPAPDNPYLNVTPRHPFNVGYDFNHESEATVSYIDQVMEFWLTEYRVDGFRFDLSKGFTQTDNPDNAGAWSNYDASRIAIIEHYADVMWQTNNDAYVTLEHLAAQQEEKELSEYGNGILLWSGFNPHNAYLEGAMGFSPNNIREVFAENKGLDVPHLIAYMESHDEERMGYKTQAFGNMAGSYNVKNFATAMDRSELASAFFYTVPGPKMLWQFGELGYDFSINQCPNGGINNGCRTDPKPIRWDYYQNPDRRDLYNVTAALIGLRNDYPVFHTDNYAYDLIGKQKRIHLLHPDMDVAVVGNFDVLDGSVTNPFPHGGRWYEYFSGDSLDVAENLASLALAPGEYRLYTTNRLPAPAENPVGVRESVTDAFRLWLQPNPVSAGGNLRVTYQLTAPTQVSLRLLDINGRPVFRSDLGRRPAGPQQEDLTVGRLPAGTYLLELRSPTAVQVSRVVVF
ncbi:MAG: alpha-amylase family glycosyl hydrolase [Saprospiraceae bacterium]